MNWKLLLLFFIFWFGLLSLTGTLFSGYHLTDDQDVLRIKQAVSNTSIAKEARIFSRDFFGAQMRFRPVHNLHRRLTAMVLGSNFTAWSIYFALLAAFTSLFLFLFARKIGFSPVESGLFVGLTLLGEQAAIWWKLGANETLGMFVLAAALLYMAKSTYATSPKKKNLWEFLFILFTITASLCKESFILMIPALIFWKIWLTLQRGLAASEGSRLMTTRRAIRENIVTIVVLAAVCLAELINIIKNVGTTGIHYAGYEGFSPAKFFKTGIQGFMTIHGWVILFILAWGIIYRWRRKKVKAIPIFPGNVLWGTALAGLIVIPQIVLYMKSGMMERYLLPGIMGYTFLTIMLLNLMWKDIPVGNQKFSLAWNRVFSSDSVRLRIEAVIILILAVICILQLRVTRYTAAAFADEGKQTNAWFQSIQQNTRQHDLILVITHPKRYFEASVSFKAFLDIEMKRRNTLFSPSSLTIESTRHTFWNHLNQDFFKNSPGFQLSNPGDRYFIQAILIFPNLEKKFLAASVDWFDPMHFERYTNAAGYVSFYKKKIEL